MYLEQVSRELEKWGEKSRNECIKYNFFIPRTAICNRCFSQLATSVTNKYPKCMINMIDTEM